MNVLLCSVVFIVAILQVGECSDTCCNDDSDCPELHCCVKPLRGKRSLASCGNSGGRCTRYGGLNQGCHVGHRFTCPCLPGLTCVGTGLREIPQGEVGVCRTRSYGKKWRYQLG
ncbi:uncharacterized protein LOC128189741 [Crassostrea angulata]|uniref:uncharacterized protein LOC128189741 n=1 Tax=Magallana angulata TaxID=2784310 RepID=UPI0005C376F2|nr:uncharacterized protein LOC128189741 [Crassostrea angulata]|eukprot:XP_011418244.1 PREDICTED: uncharacterized protein LOC105321594 [Crassostrea gigas]